MPVDAIGQVLNANSAATSANNNISQDDFLRLFLSQLRFQDPLQPTDNTQFLAQLASFTQLEQSKQTTAGVDSLVTMFSQDQALALLNRTVQVQTGASSTLGTITAINFSASGVQLTVQPGSGSPLTGIRLSQVTLVRP